MNLGLRARQLVASLTRNTSTARPTSWPRRHAAAKPQSVGPYGSLDNQISISTRFMPTAGHLHHRSIVACDAQHEAGLDPACLTAFY